MNSNTLTNPALTGWNPTARMAALSKFLDIGTSVIGRLVELNVASLGQQGASNLSHFKSLSEVRDFSALLATHRQFLQSAWQAQEDSMKTACEVLQQGMEDAQTALRGNSAGSVSAHDQPVASAPLAISSRTEASTSPTPVKQSVARIRRLARQPDAAEKPRSKSLAAGTGTSRVVFEIYQDKAGEYRFRLQGPDGRTLLRSEGYRKRRGAVNGVNAVKKNVSNDARYDKQTSPAGKPSFNLKAGNHQVIGSSRTFSSVAQMDTAIELMKETALNSGVRDLTATA